MSATNFLKATKWKVGGMLVGSFLALIHTAPAQTNLPAHPQAQRFLIVFETSRVMARRAENSIKTVSNLIGSGLSGQMQTGDTLGLWTFNDSLSTGKFPLAKWWGENSKEIAEAATGFLHQQRFEKGADFRQAMIGISKVAENSDRLTVVFISSGETELSGTKYDAVINDSFKTWRAEQERARMPVITVLRASRGEFVGNSVTPAPWQIELPPWPQRVLAALTPKTNPAPRLAAPSTEGKSLPVVSATTNSGALIFSGRKSNPATASTLAAGTATSASGQPESLTPTQPAEAVSSSNAANGSVPSPVFISAAAISNSLAGAPSGSPFQATGSANPRADEPAQNGGVLQVHARPLDSGLSSSSPAADRAPEAKNNQPIQSAAALPAPSGLSRKLVLAVGLGLTAFIGVFLFIRGGGNTRQESLITRSYQRQRK